MVRGAGARPRPSLGLGARSRRGGLVGLLPLLLLANRTPEGVYGALEPFRCEQGTCRENIRSRGVRVTDQAAGTSAQDQDLAATGALFIKDAPGQEFTAGFTCHSWGRRLEAPHWVVGFGPLLDKQHGLDVVHHINVFGCSRAVAGKAIPSLDCARNSFLLAGGGAGGGSACSELLVMWDKGAEDYSFPEGMGIRVGPGSMHEVLLVQVHYLWPRGVPREEGARLEDNTGMWLDLSRSPRASSVGTFAMTDTSMVIPPGRAAHETVVWAGTGALSQYLARDLEEHGRVQPVAVHLHAHTMAAAIRLEHWRNGTRRGLITELRPYGGYGPDQSLLPVRDPGGRWALERGDGLRLVCTFNSSGAGAPVRYGVGHGMEMCAMALLFAPHDPEHAVKGEQAFGNFFLWSERQGRPLSLVSQRQVPGLGNLRVGSAGRGRGRGGAWFRDVHAGVRREGGGGGGGGVGGGVGGGFGWGMRAESGP